MTIRELEVRCGLDRATIRYYEKEGLLAPVRQANGYRDYSEEDALALDKIALLRQLGLSLEMIRTVQRGELPLGVALEKQSDTLLQQREETDRTLQISRILRDEGVSYQTLQPEKYRLQLQPRQWEPRVIPPAKPRREDAAEHWAARLAARLTDELLVRVPVLCLISYGLRIRSDAPSAGLLLILLGWLIGMLTEPLLLSTWGYTPGKWVMALRLRTPEDGDERKLTFREAFFRYWKVQLFGFGLGIFPFGAICAFKCWKRSLRGEEQPWDACDFVYSKDERDHGGLMAAALWIVCVGLMAFVSLDAQRPMHRSDRLTRTEYVENINDLLEYTFDSDLEVNAEGVWFSDSRSSKGDDRDVMEIREENGVVTGVSMTFSLYAPPYSLIPSRRVQRMTMVLALVGGDRDVNPELLMAQLDFLFYRWEDSLPVGDWMIRQTVENLPEDGLHLQGANDQLFYQGEGFLNAVVHFSIEKAE